jgi:hypothetical protein
MSDVDLFCDRLPFIPFVPAWLGDTLMLSPLLEHPSSAWILLGPSSLLLNARFPTAFIIPSSSLLAPTHPFPIIHAPHPHPHPHPPAPLTLPLPLAPLGFGARLTSLAASILQSTASAAHATFASLASASPIKAGSKVPDVDVRINDLEDTINFAKLQGKNVLVLVPGA